MWYERLADVVKVPLFNADRLMMSILPEVRNDTRLADWAREIRDKNTSWMKVSQAGVKSFVSATLSEQLPFAMETVFSYWQLDEFGHRASKIDDIRQMQSHGYYVVLVFVGLSSADLSTMRVATRVDAGGHDVPIDKLNERFPRTQQAIAEAIKVANAAILVDNSRGREQAFTVAQVRFSRTVHYDIRNSDAAPAEIRAWLDKIAPEKSRPKQLN